MERAETVGWNTFWAEHGQSWRTEPEIAAERQAELEACRAITPDVRTAPAPFPSCRITVPPSGIAWGKS